MFIFYKLIGHLYVFLEKCLFRSSAHLLLEYLPFYCWAWRISYIFWMLNPYQIWFINIFSYSVSCLFTFMVVLFYSTKVFCFDEVQFICFSLWIVLLASSLRTLLLALDPEMFSPMFLVKFYSFIFYIKSFIHLNWVLYKIWNLEHLVFCLRINNCSSTVHWKAAFFLHWIFCFCQK